MREEGLGTGLEREVNRGLVKFKMADEIVGVKVIDSNWYFYSNNQIIGLKRKSLL